MKLRYFVAFALGLGIASANPLEKRASISDKATIGYATLYGGTTGGGSASPVTVTTLSVLKSALSSGNKVVLVSGTITGSEVIKVPANTSVIGKSGSALSGVGLRVIDVSNVIIRNLKIIKVLADAGDAIGIQSANRVWVDSVELYSDRDHDKDYYDGLLDITHGSYGISVTNSYLQIVPWLMNNYTDVDTLKEHFEESRKEIEDTLDTWGSTVETDLVSLLNSGTARDGKEAAAETPELNLQYALPPKHHGFFESPSACHQLLRAHSVFRIVNDNPCPPPLYYTELFPVFQSRNRHYFKPNLDIVNNGPSRLGYVWDTDEVACYAEGVIAAKALLDQLGRPNAAQFELQALDPRFSCGPCLDK
ncbi:hypothetical protein FS749_011866 [Ceratobasidium sp. UAMH 11750]|nr:hypothetical protein FS749_011866 [Ceratobasidium sp. UAMH 11750]